MSYPSVILLGRPNVGKSTLFNRLLGKRQAVVADVAGTTRDRLEHIMEWSGKWFSLVDMAGLELTLQKNTPITIATQAQVKRALASADLIVWVVDAIEGATSVEQDIAGILRSLGKPVVMAVNKSDHPKHDINQYDFAALFQGEIITLSALHSRGVHELLDAIVAILPERKDEIIDTKELRISIVGRPNVGKSTLLNRLVGDERSIVSDIPGTTRDSVDTVIPAISLLPGTQSGWKTVRIIDTAGIRRSGKVGRGIENWSIVRTLESIRSCDVVLFLIDANEGMVHQDLQIAQEIMDAGRAVILIVNKWDCVLQMKGIEAFSPEEAEAQDVFLHHLRSTAPFLYWMQVLFLSAAKGQNIEVVGQLVVKAYRSWSVAPTPEELKELTTELKRWPRLRNLKSITLEHSQPPVFHLHVEGKDLPHFSTHRAVENAIREHFELGPTPIKIWSVPSVTYRRTGRE